MTLFTKPQKNTLPPQTDRARPIWPIIIQETISPESSSPYHKKLTGLIRADMQARHDFGMAKYGHFFHVENGRDPLIDAYQEYLDGVHYLRAEIEKSGMTDDLDELYSMAKHLMIATRAMLLKRYGE